MSPKHVASPYGVLWGWEDREEHPGFGLGEPLFPSLYSPSKAAL